MYTHTKEYMWGGFHLEIYTYRYVFSFLYYVGYWEILHYFILNDILGAFFK